jgi:hypothetical protein
MFKLLLSIVMVGLLSGCASQFPRPLPADKSPSVEPSGVAIFETTFNAHGGQHLEQLDNVNVGLTGKWKQLIRRIQPLVSDYTFRVDSQERLLPKQRVYAAQYSGPAGAKSVFRTPNQIEVYYNKKSSMDPAVLSSTALTADAFHLFLLGPLALSEWRDQFTRLEDARLNGKNYQRIYLKREPGFGYALMDEVVLWVNPLSGLTKKIQITLEGHKTTRGAHVEVEYLDYRQVDRYTFPVQFFERVNAPISIDAHAWRLTGIDINRDYQIAELRGAKFAGQAADDAEKIAE